MKGKMALCVFAAVAGSVCVAGDPDRPTDRSSGEKGMYFDIHVHANAWNGDGFNLDRVSEWMDEHQVKRCIIQQFRQTLPRNEEERKLLVDNFEKYRGKIFPFCVIFAGDVATKEDAVKVLRGMKRDGAIGFGEHYGEGLNVDDPKNLRLYEACAEVGLPILFHMDKNNNMDEKGLPHLEHAVKSNPNTIFIAHAPGWWQNMPDGTCEGLLQKYPNLYGDLSAGSGAGAISRDRKAGRDLLIRNADKLLFGTDSGSWSKERPASQFTLFESLDLPVDVKAKIYGENAEGLFDLTGTGRSATTDKLNSGTDAERKR